MPAAHARQVESNGVRPDTTVTITEHQNDGCGKYFLAWVSTPTYSTYQIWKKASTATTYALYQTVADDFADVVVGTSGQYDFKIKAGTAFSAPVRLTGTKPEKKKYFHHTLYPGGATFTRLSELLEKHPERVVQKAVKGMMPKTKLGDAMMKKLKVYAGAEHPHEAQQPETWSIQA